MNLKEEVTVKTRGRREIGWQCSVSFFSILATKVTDVYRVSP